MPPRSPRRSVSAAPREEHAGFGAHTSCADAGAVREPSSPPPPRCHCPWCCRCLLLSSMLWPRQEAMVSVAPSACTSGARLRATHPLRLHPLRTQDHEQYPHLPPWPMGRSAAAARAASLSSRCKRRQMAMLSGTPADTLVAPMVPMAEPRQPLHTAPHTAWLLRLSSPSAIRWGRGGRGGHGHRGRASERESREANR